MLLLVFHVKEDCYAIDSINVKEVIPLLNLQSISKAPEYVAGLLNYRGTSVPVIDLCQFLKGKQCNQYYNSRIIIVNYINNSGTALLGLIAENVTDVLRQESSELKSSGVKLDTSPFLGKIVLKEDGMIQTIELDKLLTNELAKLLFTESA